MANRLIKGEQRTESYLVKNLLSGASVGTWQEDYSLREVDFERIKNGKPITFFWANSLLLTTFGFALGLVAKGYSNLSAIKEGEWIALLVGIVSSLFLYLVGILLPNKRKQVMKNIEEHFKRAPTSRQAFRGAKK